MTLFEFLVVAAAALAAAYLLILAVVLAARPFQQATMRATSAFSAPFAEAIGGAEHRDRLDAIEREVQRRIGLDTNDADEDMDVINAAVAAQGITVLNDMLRRAIATCLRTHWAIARTLDAAADMGTAARHQSSRRSRQRVVDLTTTLAARIDNYPLIAEAPELLTLRFGIKHLGVTCVVCPYFTTTVGHAPAVCPTAEAIAQKGHRSSAHASEVIDGVVIEAAEDEQ